MSENLVVLPWEVPDAPPHVRRRQPVMEIPGLRGVRRDLLPWRALDPICTYPFSFGIAIMSHRGSSNGRLSVLLSSLSRSYPVIVSSDSVAEEDIESDRVVCAHHGAEFRHCTPWGGRAKNALHTMYVAPWDVVLFLNDDVWLFPECVRESLAWYHTLTNRGIPIATIAMPGWETYANWGQWGFENWGQCLAEPWRFECIPANPAFAAGPQLHKNAFGACMLMNRRAYEDLYGFRPEYWAEDDVWNHQVWVSGKWVVVNYPGRGYMHLGAQSWHHGEAVEYVGSFAAAAGMSIEESGRQQVAAIEKWQKEIGHLLGPA